MYSSFYLSHSLRVILCCSILFFCVRHRRCRCRRHRCCRLTVDAAIPFAVFVVVNVSLYLSFLRISPIAARGAVYSISFKWHLFGYTFYILLITLNDLQRSCWHTYWMRSLASSRLYFTFPVCVQSNLKHISLFYIYRIHIFHMNMWYDISKKKKQKKNLSPSVYS